jgi:transcriptional regulator with XRE-family HTH domain
MFVDGKEAALWVETESKRLGVSVRFFCKKVGLANSTVIRWKQGYNDPLPVSLRKINSFLDRQSPTSVKDIIR